VQRRNQALAAVQGADYDETVLAADSHVIDQVLDPVRHCLTPDVARRIADLRADSRTQARIDQLAEKSSAGSLTRDEAAEYDAYLAAINFMGILQAKARAVLAAT
jgi:hypothetical protein